MIIVSWEKLFTVQYPCFTCLEWQGKWDFPVVFSENLSDMDFIFFGDLKGIQLGWLNK